MNPGLFECILVFQILIPFNLTADMNICDVSFKHIGSNFPGFTEDQVSISYLSQVQRPLFTSTIKYLSFNLKIPRLKDLP